MNKKLTYNDSGVNIEAGDKAVDLIKEKAQETFKNYPGEVLSQIGGFSGAVKLKDGRVMGTSTDGVGTKLVLSILLDKHHTVGIDLVAMCVNDLIVNGIEPAVFLDYIAMGKQIPERTQKIVEGIIKGCNQAECALLGGEMAEMPGMYGENDYDLAGFAIGFADSEDDLITGGKIEPDMYVYGLPSSGIHSNGYSLVRKVFEIDLEKTEEAKQALNTFYPELRRTLGEELLEPTQIYVKPLKEILKKYQIFGIVHITGGGLIENPPRILPSEFALEIDKSAWKRPEIFNLIQKKGGISEEEMLKTFNCGLGLVIISTQEIPEAIKLGKVIKKKDDSVSFI